MAGTPGDPPMQSPMLVASSTAVLFTVVLTAGAVHWMLTQGAGLPEMLKAQPTIVVTSDITSTGLPAIRIVGFCGTTIPWPP